MTRTVRHVDTHRAVIAAQYVTIGCVLWWRNCNLRQPPSAMVARVRTVAFQGIDVLDVDVQVQIANGLPAFAMVGLPDKAVGESRERVRAALHALGLSLPPKRITVNLAPADLQKEGSHFDLPVAIGLLTVMGVLPEEEIERFVALGELALDGALMPVAGVLPAGLHAAGQERGLICPAACGGEAAARASWRRRTCWRWSTTSRARRSWPRLSRGWRRRAPHRSTCGTSRGRRAPSARWRWRRRAATTS
jgi:hypothetical protein